jgi:hypothetical protein
MAARHMKRREEGGKVENKNEASKKGVKPYDAQGSHVEEEAERDEDGGELKRGGRVKKKKSGGKVEHEVEGKKPRHRMDRACSGGAMKRAKGGRVGSDLNPMSSAKLSPPKGHSTDD